jgi:hypothetical protein
VGQGAGSRRPGGGPAKVRLTCRCAPQRVFGESEYRRLFETFAQENAQAIVVSKGAENIAQRHLIVELAEGQAAGHLCVAQIRGRRWTHVLRKWYSGWHASY